MQSEKVAISGLEQLNTLSQVRMHLKFVGCVPIESNRFYRFLCIQIYIVVIFIVLISYSMSSLSFLFFNVKTFIDFTESAFWASRSVLSLAVYATFVWHRKDLAKILDNLSEIVHKRKAFSKWFLFKFFFYKLFSIFLGEILCSFRSQKAGNNRFL